MKRVVYFITWPVAFVISFFAAKLISAPLLENAPLDADVGYAAWVGVFRIAVMLLLLWLVMRTVRSFLKEKK